MLYKSNYRIETSRLKDWDYSTPWWYYVTTCTKNFRNWLGEVKNGKMILNEFGKIVEEEWLKTKEIRATVDLDFFVIMPNHFHGILILRM
jgi:REP element-mobilizing transposase RayT